MDEKIGTKRNRRNTEHPLRPYQTQAVEAVYAKRRAGKRRICLVSPTGSGKTRLAEEFVCDAVNAGETVLFIVHRRELLKQAAERLRRSLGRLEVGIIAPGEDADPHAVVQVATVQTLLARRQMPKADLIILDECHHYVAADWKQLADAYPNAYSLGLTATPERQDGKPLGDIFDDIVVAAKYSQLVTDGHLVSCRVYQPPENMGGDLALDPVVAYQRYAEGSQAFLFAGNVKLAEQCTQGLNAIGVSAATIHAKLPKRDRDEALARFAAGQLRVLSNFNVLTEGVDIPAARAVILGRSFDHVGAYLQAAGRVLRPATGKPDAIIIDLTGATLRHGFPTEDREYSLEGNGIRRSEVTPLRNCLQCGATLHASLMTCPDCGYVFKKRDPRIPRIYSLELREVYAGVDTPGDAKSREYARLRELQRSKGWNVYWVIKQYRQLFGEAPVITDATPEEKRAEYLRLVKVQTERGFKPGFVKIRYKEMFGGWPGREVLS